MIPTRRIKFSGVVTIPLVSVTEKGPVSKTSVKNIKINDVTLLLLGVGIL